ncbi:[acyl-carrier-protein] S-malonyltransferase [Natranaerovirga pectinivora]|uniref:Malonyl CoA-acyl carrier protein transacylase n=1 Tax=Natranaerovirga pectinivora TaxID=682400 RepID=A0A4R3MKF6_9FIRM|nr:ACP S-malonyltransferase [Natranaerovirga pectinivora]TCT12292.1 [acyl-carrier-protein] S-malonyltransferase [Natranaerovirga pectinivora]
MSKIAFVFPGQGSQYVGMGNSFYEEFTESREIFDIASEALQLDMKKLCFEENEQLNITEFTQPAILTATIATLKALETVGIKPDVVAGLSLGEYSALVANKTIDFRDAVKVVRARGKLMQEAVPVGVGTMAAILGLPNETVEEVCKGINGIVELANYNCPGQIVISGENEPVNKAVELLKEAGAKRALLLNVSGPFHSSLLQPAGDQLKEVLENVQFNNMVVPYIANTTAEYVNTIDDVKPLLIQQVYSSVKWEQSIIKMIENGVDTFIEIGPGKTLSGFIRKIDRHKTVINIDKSSDLKDLPEKLGGVIC